MYLGIYFVYYFDLERSCDLSFSSSSSPLLRISCHLGENISQWLNALMSEASDDIS